MAFSEYTSDVFRQIHAAENERHERLNAQLTLPTAIVTVLCGLLSFYLDKYPAESSDGYVIWFGVCLLALFVSVGCAIVCLILAMYSYTYRYTSHPRDVESYMRGMEAWYIAIGVEAKEIPEKIESDMRELMTEQYMECAATNRKLNSEKAKFLHFAKLGIVIALVSVAVSIYPFHMGVKGVEKIHKVQLVKE